MDKDMLEMREAVGRIDERTEAILTTLERQANNQEKHEEQDREDFKEVHDRVSRTNDRVEDLRSRQNWIMGVGTTLAFVGTAALTWLKSFGI